MHSTLFMFMNLVLFFPQVGGSWLLNFGPLTGNFMLSSGGSRGTILQQIFAINAEHPPRMVPTSN